MSPMRTTSHDMSALDEPQPLGIGFAISTDAADGPRGFRHEFQSLVVTNGFDVNARRTGHACNGVTVRHHLTPYPTTEPILAPRVERGEVSGRRAGNE